VHDALADFCLPWVDTRGLHLHEHLTRAGLGHGHVHDVEHIDAAVLAEPHRLHPGPPSIAI
jgi:hypothetical protein